MFAAVRDLHGTQRMHTNTTATNAFVTADDYYKPLCKVSRQVLKIVPAILRSQAGHALGGQCPLVFFLINRRALGEHSNHFSFLPGYRSSFGLICWAAITWYLRLN